MNWDLYAIMVFFLAGLLLLVGAWILRGEGKRSHSGDRFGLYSYISLGTALVFIGFGLFFLIRL